MQGCLNKKLFWKGLFGTLDCICGNLFKNMGISTTENTSKDPLREKILSLLKDDPEVLSQ